MMMMMMMMMMMTTTTTITIMQSCNFCLQKADFTMSEFTVISKNDIET
jgi:hypothetical protein